MSASIGPNSSKNILPGIDGGQQKFQPPFGHSMNKFLSTFKDFAGKIGLQNVALFGQNFTLPAGLINSNKKITGILSSGKQR